MKIMTKTRNKVRKMEGNRKASSDQNRRAAMVDCLRKCLSFLVAMIK
jgi:hypothetical protein